MQSSCQVKSERYTSGHLQTGLKLCKKTFYTFCPLKITKKQTKNVQFSTYPFRFAKHLTREALFAFYGTMLLWDKGAWLKIARPLFSCHNFSLLPFLILLWLAALIRHLLMFCSPKRVKSLNILTKILPKMQK